MEIKFLIGNLSDGGAERVVSDLSSLLADKHKCTVLLFGKNSKITYQTRAEIQKIDSINEKNPISKILTFFYRVAKVRKAKEKSDVFISFLEYSNLINCLSGYKKKTVISVRNHMSNKHNKGFKSFIWRSTIRFFYNSANSIVCVSNEIKYDLIKNYKINEKKVKVIYNQLYQDRINTRLLDDFSSFDNFSRPIILTVGRLSKQKSQVDLIKAFSIVNKKMPRSTLIILGDGPLKKQLISLISELKLEDKVKLMGFVDNPYIYMKNADLFVLSSIYEGFPNVIIEAMYCGLPIVSTDCPSGPDEILSESNHKSKYGILVPLKNGAVCSQILADSILSILQSNQLLEEFKTKSLLRALEYSNTHIIEKWEKLLESVKLNDKKNYS